MNRRVVVTGLGVIAPLGIGKENFWDGMMSGKSAVREITDFDTSGFKTKIAAQVKDFDPLAYGLTQEEA
ncbi:MAG: hypothetical protein GQ554_10135, partial [Deltaproteobacteria bacterium]|nr:hypothetical protein [Deltaproteobacteria bacterium]